MPDRLPASLRHFDIRNLCADITNFSSLPDISMCPKLEKFHGLSQLLINDTFRNTPQDLKRLSLIRLKGRPTLESNEATKGIVAIIQATCENAKVRALRGGVVRGEWKCMEVCVCVYLVLRVCSTILFVPCTGFI